MPDASPAFSINGNALLAKASVSAASTVTATLDSLAGVRGVEWEIASTDETNTATNYTLVTSGLYGSIVSFTSLGMGTAGILKCRVNGGFNSKWHLDAAMTATAKFYVETTGGYEVGASGETTESDKTHGSTGEINTIIRVVSSSGGGGGVQSVTSNGVAGIDNTDPTNPIVVVATTDNDGLLTQAFFNLLTGATVSATANTLVKRDGVGGTKLTTVDSGGISQLNLKYNGTTVVGIHSAQVDITGGLSVTADGLVEGDLEVDGTLFVGATLTVGSTSEFQDVVFFDTDVKFNYSGSDAHVAFLAAPSNVACKNLVLVGMAAFSSASGTNRNPGGVVVSLSDPTNSQTIALGSPAFRVIQGSHNYIAMGRRRNDSVSAYGTIWVGDIADASRDDTNYCFGSDGSTSAVVNSPTGGTTYFTVGGSVAMLMTLSQLAFAGITNLHFADGSTVLIDQAQSATGTNAAMVVRASKGFTGHTGSVLAIGGGDGGTPGTDLAGGTTIKLGQAVSNQTAPFIFDSNGTELFRVDQIDSATFGQAPGTPMLRHRSGAAFELHHVDSDNGTWALFIGHTAVHSGIGVDLNGSGQIEVILGETGSKLGFYGQTPVLRQTRAGQLSGSSGTTGTAISDAGTIYSQSTLNNNFRALEDAYNRLENIIHTVALST